MCDKQVQVQNGSSQYFGSRNTSQLFSLPVFCKEYSSSVCNSTLSLILPFWWLESLSRSLGRCISFILNPPVSPATLRHWSVWLHRHNKSCPLRLSAFFRQGGDCVDGGAAILHNCAVNLFHQNWCRDQYDISSRATSNLSCVCSSFCFENLQKSPSFSTSSSFSLHSLVMISVFSALL